MEQPTQPVRLGHPSVYIATFMVNRFCLIKNKGFTVGHFGLVDDSGLLLERFGCIFSDTSLSELRENLVAYSAKVGVPKQKAPTWTPKIEEAQTSALIVSQYGVVDFIHLTNWHDSHAEICFWNYSKASLGDHLAQKMAGPFPTWGLAMLRCDIDLQREFLEALYPA